MNTRLLHCLCLISLATIAFAAEPDKPEWRNREPQVVGKLTVTLSEPVLVARSEGYLWFPTVVRLASGELLAVMSNYHDDHVEKATAKLCWSRDNGLTWSQPQDGLYSDSAVQLPSGEQLLLPYYLRPQGDKAMGAAYQLVSKDKRDSKVVDPGIKISGWPRADRSFSPKLGLSGFVFNGNSIKIKDGYLATLYGFFEGAKRYNLVAAESKDGENWTIRSVVADDKCELAGGEGPCEAAMCRVKDGQLMCLFRLASNVPYGQVFSDDDGQTWSKPVAVAGASSVQPALAALKSGPIVLTGGRPGLWAWFNAAGDGKDWNKLDLLAHHNACRPDDPIANPANGTSAYTEVVPLDDGSVLCIYDRLARGWNAIPKESGETNSVWVVRIAISQR